MKKTVKIGMVLVVLVAAVWMNRQQKGRLAEIDTYLEEDSSVESPPEKRLPSAGSPSEKLAEPEPVGAVPPPNNPEYLRERRLEPEPQYDAEFMRAFFNERRDMAQLESVDIGRREHRISKNYKAVLLPKGEGQGYYRIGSWTVVPLDYNEDEGYPVLFNRNDKSVHILIGLVSVKVKDDVELERGIELLTQEDGLEVDTVTHHLKIIHAKYSPVTGQALKNYEKKLEQMGIFSRVEVEIYGGGPYPN